MNKPNPNDDLWYALRYNSLKHVTSRFSEKDIISIEAEVPGENDEFEWWWILKVLIDRDQPTEEIGYALINGYCCMSGWDCESGINFLGVYVNPLIACANAPVLEKYSGRKILDNLVGQITGRYPKYTYWT